MMLTYDELKASTWGASQLGVLSHLINHADSQLGVRRAGTVVDRVLARCTSTIVLSSLDHADLAADRERAIAAPKCTHCLAIQHAEQLAAQGIEMPVVISVPVPAPVPAPEPAPAPKPASTPELVPPGPPRAIAPRPAVQVPNFLTVATAADLMKVSKMTVYRLIHAGELPASRIGRSFRVAEGAVLSYLGLIPPAETVIIEEGA